MRRKSVVVIFVAMFLLLLGSGWCLADEIKLQSGQTIITNTPQASPEEVKAFWTQERMFQALANPMVKEILTEDLKLTIDAEEPQGEPKSEAGYCPDCPANQSTYGNMDEEAAGTQTISSPCPASGYSWQYDYANGEYPERVMGRLFFTTETGGLAVCSASLVNRRLLLTAGHCVCNGAAAWYSNFYFIPGYKDGVEPYGRGYAANIIAFTNYFNTGIWSHDIAVMILTEDIGNSLGWLGFSANRDAGTQQWLQFGYPAADPFDGKWLVVVLSALGYRVGGIGTPMPTAVGSILTQGASGGPWIVTDADNIYANGVNSAKPVSCAETTISPYFGEDAWNMYIYARDNQ
jgi:hypothetical protein